MHTNKFMRWCSQFGKNVIENKENSVGYGKNAERLGDCNYTIKKAV